MVCGSRDCDDQIGISRILTLLSLLGGKPAIMITGGAVGVDTLAGNWAIANDVRLVLYQPEWTRHGKSAGVIRNTQLVNDADFILAFWDGRSKGTRDSIQKAMRSGKPLLVFNV